MNEQIRVKKVVLLTNIPSPYNVDLFWHLQNHTDAYDFYPVYTSETEDNRKWKVKEERIFNTRILNSRVLKLNTGIDHRYVHIPPSVTPVLNDINPDIVIAWEYNPAALMALHWCRRHERKFIHVTEGTLNSEQNLNVIQKASRKYIISHADYCIACSTKAKEKLLAWKAEPLHIETALLTVDIEDVLDTPHEPVTGRILYVGSLAKRKGVDLLVEALPKIRRRFELHICGDSEGEEKDALTASLKAKHLDHCVTWCGYVEGKALRKEYSEASVFVLPTREDCFGLVLVEAMAAGVPIVSSKYADGAYDVIQEGINGEIVDPFDSTALARAIENRLDHQTDQRTDTEDLIQKFRYEDIVTHYYKALDRM